jgi:hypothetical protein
MLARSPTIGAERLRTPTRHRPFGSAFGYLATDPPRRSVRRRQLGVDDSASPVQVGSRYWLSTSTSCCCTPSRADVRVCVRVS